MPITIDERVDSRGATESDDPTADLIYLVQGTDDDLQVRSLVAATAPTIYAGLKRDNFTIETLGAGIWECKVHYIEFSSESGSSGTSGESGSSGSSSSSGSSGSSGDSSGSSGPSASSGSIDPCCCPCYFMWTGTFWYPLEMVAPCQPPDSPFQLLCVCAPPNDLPPGTYNGENTQKKETR